MTGTRRIASFGALYMAAMAASGAAQDAQTNTVVQYDAQQIQLEIAYYRKLQADQIFLLSNGRGDDVAAEELYEAARDGLRGLDRRINGESQATFELLQAEIDFRIELLRAGLDYWGGSIARSPSIPTRHLERMDELLRLLEGLSGEITEAERIRRVGQIESLAQSVHIEALQGDLRSSLPQSERLTAIGDASTDRISTLVGQIEAGQALQRQLASKQEQLAGQLDSVIDRMNQALVQGVTQALGLPAEASLFTKEGRLEESLLEYVTNEASLLDSPAVSNALEGLTPHLEEFQTTFRTLKEDYDQAKELYERGKDYEAVTQSAERLLQNPTIENVLLAGETIAQKMGEDFPEALDEWRQVVEQAQPVLAAVDVIRTPGALSEKMRLAVADYLANVPSFGANASAYIDALVVANRPALAQWYSEFLKRSFTLQLDDAQYGELATLVARAWPTSFIQRIPEVQRKRLLQQVRARIGFATESEAARYLQERLVDFEITVARGQIFLVYDSAPNAVGSLSDLIELPAPEKIEIEEAQIENAVREALRRIVVQESELRTALINELPFENIESSLRQLVGSGGSSQSNAWASIVSQLDETSREQVTDHVAALQIGSVYVNNAAQREALASRPRQPPLEMPRGEEASGDPVREAATEAAISYALDAAAPGLGTAVNLARSFLNGMAEMDRIVDELRSIEQEVATLAEREVMMYASIDESRQALSILRSDAEVSDVQRRSALSQLQKLGRAVAALGENSDIEKEYVLRRQPLALYLAEQLREEFELLDRSLALWLDGESSARGTIERLVREDPTNARLALDRDIHLYSWLDRTGESNRTSIDGLVAHWRQLHRIARDVCGKAGCLPGNARVGQIQQTQVISLRRLLSRSDVDAFEDWLENPVRPFVANLTIMPTESENEQAGAIAEVPPLVPEHLVNVRVIDVRVGTIEGDGRLSETNAVSLYHPGVAFVRRGDKYEREAFRPIDSESFEAPQPFDLRALSDRWYDPQTSRYDLEGYGLYAAWQVRIEPTQEIRRARDVALRFAYYFQLPTRSQDARLAFFTPSGSSVETKRAVVALRSGPDADAVEVPLSPAVLRMIGDEEAFQSCRDVWLERRDIALEDSAHRDCKPLIDAAGGGWGGVPADILEGSLVSQIKIVERHRWHVLEDLRAVAYGMVREDITAARPDLLEDDIDRLMRTRSVQQTIDERFAAEKAAAGLEGTTR